MYNILLLSHGGFASGLEDTMNMIMGKQNDVEFISFLPTESMEVFQAKVENIFNKIPKERGVLILSDLFGGTPHNVATKIMLNNLERVEVLSGVNLPLLISAVSRKNEELKQCTEELIDEYHNALIRTSNKIVDYEENEEEEN